ncbi:MAG: bifunctional folylpolyglutamate synthase/dihydrofolate synthase [Roseburia sp.]
MTYQEALRRIEETKKYGSVPGLESITELMHRLGDVQDTLPIIHIAGTNGKGSVGAMVESVLRQAGYSTGRYASPAVFQYREIIQRNGAMISEEDFADCAERVFAACEDMTVCGLVHPTSFEVETAIAFVYFASAPCDAVLLEVGMGGRLDATNLIRKPVLSILTTISMDHMAFLGDTLTAIATEKAGIIKERCPVVSAMQQSEAETVIRNISQCRQAQLWMANPRELDHVSYDVGGMEFAQKGRRYRLPLIGEAQIQNVSCALQALAVLREQCGYEKLTDAYIVKGLADVHWPGRFEVVRKHPLVVLDGAHNEDAAINLRRTVENCFTNHRITYIIGVLADKEYEKILRIMLPLAHRVYTVTPQNPRALPAEKLAQVAGQYHDRVTAVACAEDACRMAVQTCDADDVILAFGSLSYLKEIKETLQ